ncbi:MAG TPA: CPBP family intramembrane glutamic endopeptidase [Kofleriaceae bacterium]|nr:CPBP family intramembrane glutamic endopeptidase [Kofleriaceae bacterium]
MVDGPAAGQAGAGAGETPTPAPARARDLRDVMVAFALACAGVAVLAAVGRALPFVDRNLGALVAVVFLYIPVLFSWRRGEDLVAYGFRAAPVGRGLAFGVGAPLVLFPIFAAAFVLFYDVVCRPEQLAWLRHLAPPGICRGWDGWSGMHAPHLGLDFLELAFVQVVVIALPEELFFRGFLHELCERALPPRRRFLGGGVGWALVLSSALFAAGHLASGLDPRRLSVFVPGLLFGWMRSATGSVLAGTIAHAASNLLIRVLEQIFF